MSYSAQLPGSITLSRVPNSEFPGGGSLLQKSCYSYIEKISAITNPVCFQHDVAYPNIITALDRDGLLRNTDPTGCKGHQIDNDFPLESKTPMAVPLVMYPTSTSGKRLNEVDMCAYSVLNWEEYIHENRGRSINRLVVHPSAQRRKKPEKSQEKGKGKKQKAGGTSVDKNHALDNILWESEEEACSEQAEISNRIMGHGEAAENGDTTEVDQPPSSAIAEGGLLTKVALERLKNQPRLKVEGTWNFLFGGQNGACCTMNAGSSQKSSKRPYVFVGVGSQLRAVQLKDSSPSSIFTQSVASVWQEDTGVTYNPKCSSACPFNDLILQITPEEYTGLVGVRRGRSVQIYGTEEENPYLLESIPNVCYGTNEIATSFRKTINCLKDPLLLGLDFNPIFNPEIITVDENFVVRICNLHKGTTCDMYALPSPATLDGFSSKPKPKGYPSVTLNEAAGVTFANFGQLFYAWRKSAVCLGDRRDVQVSRNHITQLFNLRNHVSSSSLSDQNYFHHPSRTELNEYISCVKRSNHDPYYYVGTSSKVYLMDLRVPNHSVIKISHGLQSPLAYMNVVTDENFEILIGCSQRLPETMCMITDRTHVNCVERSGCTKKNPVLHCYPRHLSNSRMYFDKVVNEGFDFPMPADHEFVKSHLYAWTTGMAVLPLISKNPKQPVGISVATSNNFGDIFWQEWDQAPVPSHRKVNLTDYKFRVGVMDWQKSMTVNICESEPPTPSKNKMKPVDCSVLLESAAKEITRLRRVRSIRHDCFKPKQLQYIPESNSTKPIRDVLPELRLYKSPLAAKILNVWSKDIDAEPHLESVEIKEEAIDPEGFMTSSSVEIIDHYDSELTAGQKRKRTRRALKKMSGEKIGNNTKRDKLKPVITETTDVVIQPEVTPMECVTSTETEFMWENSQPVDSSKQAFTQSPSFDNYMMQDDSYFYNSSSNYYGTQQADYALHQNYEDDYPAMPIPSTSRVTQCPPKSPNRFHKHRKSGFL